MSSEVWEKVACQDSNAFAALGSLVDHLHGLGLRCPSETTQGTVCAVILLLRETPAKVQALLENSMDLRMCFLNCKGRIQQVLHQRKSLGVPVPDDKYLLQLPADPGAATVALKRKAFPPDGDLIVPPRCDMDRLRLIVAQIPYRSRNQSAAALPFQSQVLQAHQAALMAASFMANGFGSGFGMGQTSPTLTVIPRRRRPLEDLLSRSTSSASVAADPAQPSSSPPLALEDLPRQEAVPPQAQSAQGGLEPSAAAVPVQNPAHTPGQGQQPSAAAMPVQNPAQTPGEGHPRGPENCTMERTSSTMMPRASVPLQESLARMASARAAEGKPGLVKPVVMKKPERKRFKQKQGCWLQAEGIAQSKGTVEETFC